MDTFDLDYIDNPEHLDAHEAAQLLDRTQPVTQEDWTMTATRKLTVTLSTRPTFEVATADNSQHITLSDRNGRTPIAEWIIGQGTRAIAYAVIAYAKRNGIGASQVQYAARPAKPEEV